MSSWLDVCRLLTQEDSEEEAAAAAAAANEPTVTCQPATATTNPTNPFAMPAPTENTSLRTTEHTTYTPGSLLSYRPNKIFFFLI